MGTIAVNHDNMKRSASRGYATATDLADYLVRKNIPFRDAHRVVELIIDYSIKHDKGLVELSLDELQQFSDLIGSDVAEVLTPEGSVAARNHIGGTSPEQVRLAINLARKQLK
ncbi:MAG: argininosuccinate lyase, partial [Anaerolineales bacterium]|nr:argininosuccinate lyase [Anaerolineales bacterium]